MSSAVNTEVAYQRQNAGYKLAFDNGQMTASELADALGRLNRRYDEGKRKLTPVKKLTEPIVLAVPVPPVEGEVKRRIVRRLETFAPQTYDELKYLDYATKVGGKPEAARQWLTTFREKYAPFAPKYVQLINRIREEDEKDRERLGIQRKHLIYVDDYNDIPYLAAALESAGFTHRRTHVPGKGSPGPPDVAGFVNGGYPRMPNGNTTIRDETFIVLSAKEEWHGKTSIYHLRDPNITYTPNRSDHGWSKKLNSVMFAKFNERNNPKEDNSVGKICRFLIIDRASAEGVNVYDIGHIWITSPPENYGRLLQIIGRGTRSCGNEGIERAAAATKVKRGVKGGYDREAWTVDVHMMMCGFKRAGGLPPILVHDLVADPFVLEQQQRARDMSNIVKQYAVDARLYKPIIDVNAAHGLPVSRDESLQLALKRFYDPDEIRRIQAELATGASS